MDFFGIGWLELIAILIIVLLVAGPKDIEKGAKGLGRLINRLNRSPSFQAVRRASVELRNLPQRLAKEANLEELRELSQEVQQVKQDVQQVKQEIKENTSNLPGTHKTFKAWVQELPADEADQTPSPEPVASAPLSKAEPRRAPSISPASAPADMPGRAEPKRDPKDAPAEEHAPESDPASPKAP